MASGPRLARNFLLLSSAEFLSKLFMLGAYAWLGRALGPADYGNLEFAAGATVVLLLFVEMGTGSYGARELAKAPERAAELLAEIAQLRLFLAVASAFLMAAFALLVPKPDEVRGLLLVFGLTLFTAPALLQWFFQGRDAMQWVAGASLARTTLFIVLSLTCVRSGDSPLRVAFIEVASWSSAALFCQWVVRRRMGFSPQLRVFRFGSVRKHLWEASTVGACDLFWSLLWYGPLVVLGLSHNDETVGWFGAAHRATAGLHTFVWLYFFNLLPSISRCVGGPPAQLHRLLEGSMRLTPWAGILVALGLAYPAEMLFATIYGEAFRPAGQALQVLAWFLPLSLISGHYRYTLIAFGLQGALARATAVGAAAAVALSWFLSPHWGGVGSAAAVLGGIFVLFTIAYWIVRLRVAPIPLGRALATPLAAAVLAVLLAELLPASSVWARTALVVAVYLTTFGWVHQNRLADWSRQATSALDRARGG